MIPLAITFAALSAAAYAHVVFAFERPVRRDDDVRPAGGGTAPIDPAGRFAQPADRLAVMYEPPAECCRSFGCTKEPATGDIYCSPCRREEERRERAERAA